jgi:uncharacterized protein (TIGR00290 family)
MDKKTLVLHSGGKDSMYALQLALEDGSVDFVASIMNKDGHAHFHAGPEASNLLRRTQLELMGLPFREISTSEENHLQDTFLGLKKMVDEEGIGYMITGDLWFPYTTGSGDMLAVALGIEVIRPCASLCPSETQAQQYMKKVLDAGIESIVYTVREGQLHPEFLGRSIDHGFLKELSHRRVDAAGEKSEYQSFVTNSPLMSGRIVIDDFDVHSVPGRKDFGRGPDSFYRMLVKDYHVEEK